MSDEIVEQDLEEEGRTTEGQGEELPLFMQEEDEQESSPDGVPVSTHVAMKRKLKGKLRDSDAELVALRTENEQLKQSSAPATVDTPKRPKLDDFDTDAEYDTALEKYENNRTKALFDNVQEQEKQKSAGRKFQERVTASMDSHFDRAAELVEKHSISPEVYQQATETVKGAMDDINPGLKTFDTFVDIIGEGSEKTVFAIGRNKTKLAMLKETLHDDRSGLKAAFFLGQETARLNGVKARTSQAPAPGSQIAGDEQGGKNVAAMKKKFNKLCESGKSGDMKKAFDLRRAAKKDKIDVKDW